MPTSWDVAKPADTDLVKDFPAVHRSEKTDMGTILGIPSATVVAAAGLSFDTDGLKKVILQDLAALPAIVGELVRQGKQLLYHSGERAINIMPTGLIAPYGGSTAPDGWLLCDGAAVSRTTYAELFAIIASAYGNGDGSTTFNLPNLKGRAPVGLDAAQTEFDVLGETGGAKLQAAHTHALTQWGSSPSPAAGDAWVTRDGSNRLRIVTGGVFTGAPGNPEMKDTDSQGADSVVQPYQVVNYIIKT